METGSAQAKKIPPVVTGGITMETPKTKPKLR